MDAEAAATRIYRTRISTISRDRYLRVTFLPHAEVSLADAEECLVIGRELAADGRTPVLVDLRQIRSLSADARVLFAGPKASRFSVGTALLVSSPISRAVGNFFLGFNRPLVPARLFTDPSAAERWLDELSAPPEGAASGTTS